MEQHPSFQLVDELLHKGGEMSCVGNITPADHRMGRPRAHHRHGHHAQVGLV